MSGSSRFTVSVPPDATHFQTVIDRTKFEQVRTKENEFRLFWVKVFSDAALRDYRGGAEFSDRRLELTDDPRPGTRMLWSTFTCKVPPGTLVMTIQIDAATDFDCTLHADFFP